MTHDSDGGRKDRTVPGVARYATLAFAVLGDSIAYGQCGQPSDTVAARLAAELTAAGVPVEMRGFAVPGADGRGPAGQVQQLFAWEPTLH